LLASPTRRATAFVITVAREQGKPCFLAIAALTHPMLSLVPPVTIDRE